MLMLSLGAVLAVAVIVVVIAAGGSSSDRTDYVTQYMETELGIALHCYKSSFSNSVYNCGEEDFSSPGHEVNEGGRTWRIVMDSAGNVATWNQIR